MVQKQPSAPSRRNAPPKLFALEVGYLLALVLVAALFAKWGAFPGKIPDPLGPVPLAIPWFGALGAVTIGLYGIFGHQDDWNPAYNYWHIARPLAGGVLGVVAYLIFVAVIDATGAPAIHSGTIVYDLIAFLVGYREATFQLLITRATDLLFSPGASPAPRSAGVIISVEPASGPPGTTVTITGRGFGSIPGLVTFGNAAARADDMQLWGDTQIRVNVPPTAAGQADVTITVAPASAAVPIRSDRTVFRVTAASV